LEYPTIDKHLELVFEVFLQFDKEYLIITLESIPPYNIMQEVGEFFDTDNRKAVRYIGSNESKFNKTFLNRMKYHPQLIKKQRIEL
jgi:hypothetical protein